MCQVLVVACGISHLHCGIWNLLVACVISSCSIWALVPNQGLNPSPLNWELGVLATGPPEKFLGFPCGSVGKESAWSAGDLGSIPGLGRSLGEGNGYSLQYSGLENPKDRGT